MCIWKKKKLYNTIQNRNTFRSIKKKKKRKKINPIQLQSAPPPFFSAFLIVARSITQDSIRVSFYPNNRGIGGGGHASRGNSSKKRRHGSQGTGTRRIATEKRSVNPFATARTRFASPCRNSCVECAPRRRSGVETYSKRNNASLWRNVFRLFLFNFFGPFEDLPILYHRICNKS